ncbi:MAG: hypothetical protein JWQ46_1347 [Phenylobacterium sp.]|nr:hypothetical protein [Phenylobacterium sp.]
MSGWWSRLLRNERGAALAEFVLVAPIMLLLLFGSVEALQAVETQRRVAHIASAVADIVAQERTISDVALNDIFQAGGLLMDPLPTNTLGQRVASFTADDSGAAKLDWSLDAPGAPYAGSDGLTVPSGYLKPKQSVIVADVSYRYHPALSWVLPDSIDLQKRAYLRPRLTDRVLMTK